MKSTTREGSPSSFFKGKIDWNTDKVQQIQATNRLGNCPTNHHKEQRSMEVFLRPSKAKAKR